MELLSSRAKLGVCLATVTLAPAAYLLTTKTNHHNNKTDTKGEQPSSTKSSSSSFWTTIQACRLDPVRGTWSDGLSVPASLLQSQPKLSRKTRTSDLQQTDYSDSVSSASSSSSSSNNNNNHTNLSHHNNPHQDHQHHHQQEDCYPNLTRHGKDSLLRKYLTPRVYDQLKNKRTKLGIQLEDMIRSGVALPWGPKPPRGIAGVYCGDAECYQQFNILLNPLIQHHHRAASRARLQRHRTNLDYKSLLQRKIDPKGEYILYTRMRLARSVQGFRFAPCIGRSERRHIEALLRECSADWNVNTHTTNTATTNGGGSDNSDDDDDDDDDDSKGGASSNNGNNNKNDKKQGRYMSVMEMSNSQHEDLVDRRILFPDPDEFAISAGFGRDWPDGRGVYYDTWHQDHPNLSIWCNAWDHFWIISDAKGGNVQDVFTRLSKATWALETSLKERGYAFVEHPRLGFLNASPVDIGTALRASVYVKLVRLGQRPDFHDIIRHLRLEAHQKDSSRYTGIFDIGNAEALGKSEVELINIMITGVGTLIELEKKLENGEDIGGDLPRALF